MFKYVLHCSKLLSGTGLHDSNSSACRQEMEKKEQKRKMINWYASEDKIQNKFGPNNNDGVIVLGDAQ